MKVFLASPHTILKFRDGVEVYENILGRSEWDAQNIIGGGVKREDIPCNMLGGGTGFPEPLRRMKENANLFGRGGDKALVA